MITNETGTELLGKLMAGKVIVKIMRRHIGDELGHGTVDNGQKGVGGIGRLSFNNEVIYNIVIEGF